MLTALQVQRVLRREGDSQSLVDVESKLARVDQIAIRTAERDRWRVEVWDRRAPINGIPAEVFLARDDVRAIGDGKIYLLYRDNVLAYFQPHDPAQSGFVAMTPKTVQTCAGRHIDQCVEINAQAAVVKAVIEQAERVDQVSVVSVT